MPRIFTDIDDTILKDGKPVQKVIDYIDEVAEEVVVLTNRPETDRKKTVADLDAIGFEYDELIMNDSGAEAPAFKAGIIKAELDAKRPVDLFIDNRADTRKAVAALGVEVMDPANVPDVVEEDDVEDVPVNEVPAAKVSNSRKLKMTIEEQLLEASAALSGLTAERDDLRATVEKLTVGAAAELESLKVEASVKDASIASLTEVVKTIEAEAAALKAAAVEAEAIKVSASKEAAKIAASVGVTPVALPQGDGAPAEAVNHYVAFMALPVGSKERNAYFEAHRSAIIKASF
jgi:ribonucleotide monophosphatase NagD (HAD superfamily)